MKFKKQRIISIIAILTMALVLSCALVACGDDTDKTGTDIVADYKVTIHLNNGQSDIVWDITKAIPTITKDGYHIAGCFLDAQLTTSTTLESLKATELTKNIDVYVKWEEHVEATDAAVEPTCTEPGFTEGKHCSVCNEILKAQTEIPALGHTGGTATCTEQATCERCNEKYGNALGHDLEHHDGQPATCTEKGWKAYVTCKREGYDHTTYEKIPALGHTGGTATCTEQATCERCNEKYGNALGHDIEHHAGQPATCTEKGWKAYVTCKRDGCDYSTYKEIPALGHTGGTATCTEQATCSVCGEKYGNLAKHDYKNGICTSCGDIYVSEGLAYALNSEGNGYSMTGIGECVDKNIYIPFEYNSKPVTNIGDYAFYGCTGVTSVTLPNSVKSIGGYAFSGCTGLTSITLPNSVTSIGGYAFYNCIELTSVTIPDSVTSIGKSAFYGCNKLQDIYITDIAAWCNISGLDNLMCYGSSNKKLYINNELATSITIPNGVTIIPPYAFYCSSLTSITIPDSVTSIGTFAFYGCYKLVEVFNKSTLTITAGSSNNGYIAYYAKDVYATEGESKLSTDENGYVIYTDRDEKILLSYVGTETELTLPSYITQIYQNAFRDCNSLTNIIIPDSVTNIGDFAFYGCAGLTSIVFPDSVKNIGSCAFFDCTGLTSITIGKGVTSIGISAFSKCRELTSISVVEGNTKYHCAGNCLIETESKTLVFGCKTSVIPTDGSVTSIGVRAFDMCSDLTSIIIPDSVTSIDNYAFDGCTSLTSITIGNGVTSIGEEAFWECTGLTSITFNGTIEEWNAISKGAYWNVGVPRTCKVVCKDGDISILGT